MNVSKLADKTFSELNEIRLAIENNPANQQDGFHRIKPRPRKKLEDLAWAVTIKMQRDKRQQGSELTHNDHPKG